eukprot:gene10444-biopygen12315
MYVHACSCGGRRGIPLQLGVQQTRAERVLDACSGGRCRAVEMPPSGDVTAGVSAQNKCGMNADVVPSPPVLFRESHTKASKTEIYCQRTDGQFREGSTATSGGRWHRHAVIATPCTAAAASIQSCQWVRGLCWRGGGAAHKAVHPCSWGIFLNVE